MLPVLLNTPPLCKCTETSVELTPTLPTDILFMIVVPFNARFACQSFSALTFLDNPKSNLSKFSSLRSTAHYFLCEWHRPGVYPVPFNSVIQRVCVRNVCKME